MVIQPVGGHRQLLGIEADEALLAEMLVDETPQLVDPRIGARERDRSTPRPAYGQAHDFDGDQREQAPHGKPVTLAGK